MSKSRAGAWVVGLITAGMISGATVAQAPRPARSAPIAVSPDGTRVWVVNPDSNSVSVLETAGDTLLDEISVGTTPATVAISPGGSRVYVANTDSNDLSVLDAATRIELFRVPLGAQPYGVAVRPDGLRVYVTETNAARVTVIDAATLSIVAEIATQTRPKGIAVSADGTRAVVTHYLSTTPQLNGNASVLDLTTNSVLSVVPLNLLPGQPGVANIMPDVAIRPGAGNQAWIPMVQAETGNAALTLTTTVHPSLAVVDFVTRAEIVPLRTQLDRVLSRGTSQPQGVDFSPNGATAFVVHEASDDVAILNANTRAEIRLVDVGSAPKGIAVTPDGAKAYVSNYLGRSVSVLSVANPATASVLTTVLVTPEPLPPNLIRGKKFFFTARDRLSADNRIACISCHPGGGHDARDWNFTPLGEGVRNTTDVRGIRDSGAVHWTANMDELQDLEFNIRKIQFGAGLVAGLPNDPFAAPNTGISQDLDDFAAFMDSIFKPVRANPNGVPAAGLNPAAQRGKLLFTSSSTRCSSCHAGSAFTDSDRTALVRHDVGTLSPNDVAGADGFDTPSLLALFESAPYLHDGRSPNLGDVLVNSNPQDRHGVTSILSAPQRADLAAYLSQLDDDRDELHAGDVTALPGIVRVPLYARDVSLTRLNRTDARAENRIQGFDLALTFPTSATTVAVEIAGITAGLPVRSISDPPADLLVGRKDFSIVFDTPIPFTLDTPGPGELVARLTLTLGGGSGGTVGLATAGTGLRNENGSKIERAPDGNLLVNDGSIAIGTPPVGDGSLGGVPLTLSRSGGQLQLAWEAIEAGGAATTYNVYRGNLGVLRATQTYDHVCLASGLSIPSISVADVTGDRYFLVSARVSGFGEGSLGNASSGSPRPTGSACPTPP